MIFKISHNKHLMLPKVSKETHGEINPSYFSLTDPTVDILTLRHIPFGKKHKKIKKVNATNRWLNFSKDRVIFVGLYTDTSFAPLIVWDIAHTLNVGGTIEFHEDGLDSFCLEKDYFAVHFEKTITDDGVIFTKISPLPAELDSGLDEWTFGIPTGPDDPTFLNAVVERILQLDIPRKEIILCGRPSDKFKYFDSVKIVGEDITAPPVKICTKKNRIAQEASYNNLCIIHDRVFLPLNFAEAIRDFGDFFPLTTFQSLFFDDKFNFVPRRYSDIGISYKAKVSSVRGLMRDLDFSKSNIFSPDVFPLTESSGFYAANAMRFSDGMYPTGSLYICKRSLWNACPQNENLNWIEFEDLEHAYRAYEFGIPTRVNPNAVTQSLISRPLLGRVSGTFLVTPSGTPSLYRTWTECLPFSRKPLIKLSQKTALDNLRKFATKYMSAETEYFIPLSAVTDSATRIKTIIDILSRIEFKLQESVVKELIADFEKLVLCDQLPFGTIESMKNKLLVLHQSPVNVFVLENDILINHFANRGKKNIFFKTSDEYFLNRSLLIYLGTFFSSTILFFRKRRVLFLNGGFFTYFKAILNTTPFAGK